MYKAVLIIFILLFTTGCKTYRNTGEKGHAPIMLNFPCDSNYNDRHAPSYYEYLDKIYDTLNHVNFEQIDVELQIWSSSTGLLGYGENVFVMRHYKKNNVWRAFCGNGYRNFKGQQTAEAFFNNSQLPDTIKWSEFWNILIKEEILTIKIPSQSEVSAKYNQSIDTTKEHSYWQDVTIDDGDALYTVEIITRDCKRRYQIYESKIISYQRYSSDIKNLANIIELIHQKTHGKW